MSVAVLPKQKIAALSLALVLVAGLSCDRVTSPPTTGEIALNVEAASAVALDGFRITVSGPTTRTLTSGPLQGTASFGELTPGTYDVIVEGLIGGHVGAYGETSGVTVTRGGETPASVTLAAFQPVVSTSELPDTVTALHFTVSYSAVPHATSYVVEWSTSPTMAGASSAVVTETSFEIEVPDEGQYYVAVRAANAIVPVGGLPSPPRPVFAFQAVALVTVLPLSPTIVDGANQQFAAVARDAGSNVLTPMTFYWSSSNTAVATVDQTGLVTSVGPGQVTITALARGIPGSATLTITSQAASKLAFTTPPTNTTAAASISTIRVAIQNPKNQVNTADNTTQVTIAIAANPGSGTLSGTATATVANGVATFNNLSINKAGTGYTLTATATSLTSATSGTFNVTPGAATQLAYVVQPAAATAGEAISPALQVEIRDASGNRVTTARNPVTLAFVANPGAGTLSGGIVMNAVDGVASFTGLSVDKAANGYTIGASATLAAPTTATSTAFNVTAGAAAALSFSTQPTNTSTDVTIASFQVAVLDRFGNLVTAGPGVTMSIGTNAGSGTLSGTTTQSVTSGIATFNDLAIDKVGTGYTLVARSGTLTATTSSAFDMTVGVPNQLAFIVGPTDAEPQAPIPLQVAIVDAHGNQTAVTNDITIGIHVNPTGATLLGTLTVQTTNGVAAFNNVAVDLSGSGYQLQATSPAVAGTLVSGSFTVALDFADISVGDYHTCGITVNGSAYCWGAGFVGGLGNGQTAANALSPVRVVGGHTFSAISTGLAHTCAIRANDGAAYCWGYGGEGQIGNGTSVFSNSAPQAVLGGHAFKSITAGFFHSCGVDNAGLAWCWGQPQLGRLGNNTTAGVAGGVNTPVAVFGGQVFLSISAGFEHTCAIQASNLAAYCWGQQLDGRLGNNVLVAGTLGTPQLVQGGLAFLSISAGQHTCAVRAPETDRRGYCWGQNANGQLGVAAGDFTSKALPTPVANSLRFANLSAGWQHSCGATISGTGFCWGNALAGRLGNGELSGNRETPRVILGGLQFTKIEAAQPGTDNGGDHSCGMATTGLYCWGGAAGSGNYGYLGDGSLLQTSIPVKVRGQR